MLLPLIWTTAPGCYDTVKGQNGALHASWRLRLCEGHEKAREISIMADEHDLDCLIARQMLGKTVLPMRPLYQGFVTFSPSDFDQRQHKIAVIFTAKMHSVLGPIAGEKFTSQRLKLCQNHAVSGDAQA